MTEPARNSAVARWSTSTLPVGVELIRLDVHADARGNLFELFRQGASSIPRLAQWNAARCAATSLRGVHAHFAHADYLVVVEGEFVFGLCDLRADQPTHGLRAMFTMTGQAPQALIIPPGVAHGFYTLKAGIQFYGMTHYWTIDDDLCCRWDDPALALPFPAKGPIISERDAAGMTFAQMTTAYEKYCREGAR
jgi:dTDP-4-dehydrorhamnose 3,5-epimerase